MSNEKKTNKTKLTKRAVDRAEPINGQRTLIWDTELSGFHLRVMPSGKKVFAVGYRFNKRQRWYTIGPYGAPHTAETARMEALAVLATVADGRDPMSEKQTSREAKKDPSSLTVSKLIELYFAEGPIDRPNKKASTWKMERSYLCNHAIPLLGNRVASEITTADFSQFQSDVLNGKTARPKKRGEKGLAVRGGHGAAVHCVRYLSSVFGWAVKRGILEDNPANKMEKLKDGTRERYLTDDEAGRIYLATQELLKEEEITEQQVDIINLIALSAARRGEILALRKSEFFRDLKLIVLAPDRHKTGESVKPKAIEISDEAIEIIERNIALTDDDEEFVFPSRSSKTGHIMAVRHSWSKIKKRAGIEDMKIHDFRHAYASFAIEDGFSLAHIGKNLGHRRKTTTDRYAHLQTGPGAKVASAVADRFRRAREKATSAQVES